MSGWFVFGFVWWIGHIYKLFLLRYGIDSCSGITSLRQTIPNNSTRLLHRHTNATLGT